MSIYINKKGPIYYVYAYIRSIDSETAPAGTPYYIGKGCNGRAYSKDHCIHLPKSKKYIVFLETNLTELGAFALERRYIKWYGRKDLGNGILYNKTDGGDGVIGLVYTQEHSIKISKGNTGKIRNNKHKLNYSLSKSGENHPMWGKFGEDHQNFGQKRTDEQKENISVSHMGILLTETTKKKISNALLNKPKSKEHNEKVSKSKIGRRIFINLETNERKFFYPGSEPIGFISPISLKIN